MSLLDPLEDGISKIELVRVGGSDLDVVNAARVSVGARSLEFSDRDAKLIRYLLKHEHTSPFEHTQLVYRIRVPIYILRQWMRHRIGVSYNEISGRYAELPLDFYIPKNWRVQGSLLNKQGSSIEIRDTDFENKKLYIEALEKIKIVYKKLLTDGIARELARGVLPLCTYTELIFTCNLVSLFHFVRLRSNTHAQWEIQQYAIGLINLAKKHFPVSINHWLDLKGIQIDKEKGTINPIISVETQV